MKKVKRRFRWFVRKLCKDSRFFAVFEPHESEGLHIHAVLNGSEELKHRAVMEAWHGRYGFAKTAAFKKNMGGGLYLAKNLFKQTTEWDTNLTDFPVSEGVRP